MGKDYEETRIDLKIQEHLKAFTPEDSVEKFADFIMAINIGLYMYLYVTRIPHLSL